MSEFLAQLQQRKLVQWALAYVAAVFALLQGVDIVAQRFGWPDSIERILIIASFVGFFVTLLLVWYHGERGAQKVSGTELLLLALLLAIGGVVLWRFVGNAPVATLTTVSSSGDAKNPVIADRKAIAVLPFVNMSGDKDNQYFSDGISEEILNVLARIPALHVAARTSSFSFQGQHLEIPQIAHDLDVRMVLEGSVRKQGERVRIAAQLIDARTGFQVWSQTYDRELKDIFAIQDEIARSIGEALQVTLVDVPKSGQNSVGTTNLKAYDLYLRALALWQTRNKDKLWQAIELLDQSVAADPKFAQGYAGLALVYAIVGSYTARIPISESLARAMDNAERAMALDPTLAEPFAAEGMVAAEDYRRATSAALLARAIALRPSFATAHQWLSSLLISNGDLAGGLAAAERASALDPRSLVVAENHAFALRTLGLDADVRALCQRTLEFAPGYSGCLEDTAMADLRLGKIDAARSMLERLAATKSPSAGQQGRELTDALAGRADRHALALRYAALPVLSEFDPASGNALESYDIPQVLMLLGEPELALGFVERLADTVGSTPDWALMLPALDPIRCEPGFVAVVEKLKTHDPHFAKVCAGKH